MSNKKLDAKNVVTIEIDNEFADICKRNCTNPVEVLNGFIADLCELNNSHGSDERRLANDYFDRVGYSWRAQ
ncbi:hypothetical protein [Methylotenera versatilis]|uniref:hypothetical protein n=1 Tax=Methylotenera versatilis TaxID=1055487 RepID=UPI0006486BAD|nr:hypothetical protein [Methylotenera versatilis]